MRLYPRDELAFVRAGDGKARFAITTTTNYGESVIASTAALPTGRWAHVAVTHSGSTGTLYVDGSVVGSSSSVPLAPFRLGGQALKTGLDALSMRTHISMGRLTIFGFTMVL